MSRSQQTLGVLAASAIVAVVSVILLLSCDKWLHCPTDVAAVRGNVPSARPARGLRRSCLLMCSCARRSGRRRRIRSGASTAWPAAGCGEVGWDARACIPWQEFAQGEYVGHARTPHVPEYRLREGDLLAVYYRRTREELSRPYELQVGDRIRVESLTAGSSPATAPGGAEARRPDDNITRELVVQPDGTITLPLLGQVRATRRTVPALRDELEERYKKFFRVPSITVTPIAVNTRLEDLLNTVDSRAGTLAVCRSRSP